MGHWDAGTVSGRNGGGRTGGLLEKTAGWKVNWRAGGREGECRYQARRM